MYKGGVTFNEREEKCPRSSPLTLNGVVKAPLQGKKVERTRKRKRATSELQEEAVTTVEERLETEEMRGFEDSSEQLVLSSRAEEDTILAQSRTERGSNNRKTREKYIKTVLLFDIDERRNEEEK